MANSVDDAEAAAMLGAIAVGAEKVLRTIGWGAGIELPDFAGAAGMVADSGLDGDPPGA
jgi:hypothetical protein